VIQFEPTTIGIGSIVVAIVVGVVAFVIRTYVDKPRNDVLRQDIDDLKKSRDDARNELTIAKADAAVQHAETQRQLHDAQRDAAAAKELATNRAKVDELFAYIQKLVIEAQPRQEKLMSDIAKLTGAVVTALETGHELRNQTNQVLVEHNKEALERHDQQMSVMSGMTDMLRKLADAFDVKLNGKAGR
jgi:F0F1-type ATP synthase membrane subunit b/b'